LNLCDGKSIESRTIEKVCLWRFGMFNNCFANVNNINNIETYDTNEEIGVISNSKNGYEITIKLENWDLKQK